MQNRGKTFQQIGDEKAQFSEPDSDEINRLIVTISHILNQMVQHSKDKDPRMKRLSLFYRDEVIEISIEDYLKRFIKYVIDKDENVRAEAVLIYMTILIDKYLLVDNPNPEDTDLLRDTLHETNHQRLIAATLMVSYKFLSDHAYEDTYLAKVFAIDIKEMLRFEKTLLTLLKYEIYVEQTLFDRYRHELLKMYPSVPKKEEKEGNKVNAPSPAFFKKPLGIIDAIIGLGDILFKKTDTKHSSNEGLQFITFGNLQDFMSAKNYLEKLEFVEFAVGSKEGDYRVSAENTIEIQGRLSITAQGIKIIPTQLFLSTILAYGQYTTYEDAPGKHYLTFNDSKSFSATLNWLKAARLQEFKNGQPKEEGGDFRVSSQANTIEIRNRITIVNREIRVQMPSITPAASTAKPSHLSQRYQKLG